MDETEKNKFLLKKYKAKIASTKNRIDNNNNPIQMLLTFEEWCDLWNTAGVLPQQPYVLSRKNDQGHYEINNVYVQHNIENVLEAHNKTTELDKKINEYMLQTGYKRRIVKAMLKRGELEL